MPSIANLSTDNVIVELPLPGAPIVVGLKVTATPGGAPLAERLMELLNPPLTAMVMVEVPTPPCATLSVDGEAEMVKVPAALSGNVNNSTKMMRQEQRTKPVCKEDDFMTDTPEVAGVGHLRRM